VARRPAASEAAAPASTSSAAMPSASAAPAPSTSAAAAPAKTPAALPTAGMTQSEFKNEVARRLGEEVKKLEVEQKTKQARAQADTRVASLRAVPAPMTSQLSAPKPIPVGAPPSTTAANTRPAAVPVRPAPAPVVPAIRRGDLVASSELDRQPQIENVVKPEYPSIARRMNIGGTVVLSVLVGETGRVEDIRVVRDTGRSVGLPQAAEKAVRQWTFLPGQKNGVPVKTWYTVPIPFVL
ncbi:MAG: TonB family protein, partial [Thermoanaerobaculia bacterium]